MDNQALQNLVSSTLPLSSWFNLLLHSHSNPATGLLAVSCILVKLLSQGHCTCCSLCLECLAHDCLEDSLPHRLQVFTQIPITFSVRSSRHPPSIPYTHSTYSLFPLYFIFVYVSMCKTVHYGNFQTYTKVENIRNLMCLSSTFNSFQYYGQSCLCPFPVQIILM